MAGAIGAVTGNGIGIASMAQAVTVMPCRYLDATGKSLPPPAEKPVYTDMHLDAPLNACRERRPD